MTGRPRWIKERVRLMIKVQMIKSMHNLETFLNEIGWRNILNVQYCNDDWFIVIYRIEGEIK